MSVVAAKVKGNKIEMASDSFCYFYHGEKRMESKKIFKHIMGNRNVFFIGVSGDFKWKNAFNDFMKSSPGTVQKPFNYLQKRSDLFDLLKTWRAWMKENHLWEESGNYKFLIACNAGLYRYLPDGELQDYEYMSIGAGALVTNALMSEGYTPAEAVEVCSRVVNNVAGEVQTANFEFKLGTL